MRALGELGDARGDEGCAKAASTRPEREPVGAATSLTQHAESSPCKNTCLQQCQKAMDRHKMTLSICER